MAFRFKLGPEPQLALLRNEKYLAVCVVEVLALQGAGDEIDMRAHAGLGAGVPGRSDRAHAVEKREFLGMAMGFHRMGGIGTSTSCEGAVRHKPMSIFSNCPQCVTVGRMR